MAVGPHHDAPQSDWVCASIPCMQSRPASSGVSGHALPRSQAAVTARQPLACVTAIPLLSPLVAACATLPRPPAHLPAAAGKHVIFGRVRIHARGTQNRIVPVLSHKPTLEVVVAECGEM